MISATALVTTFLLLPVASGSSERPTRPPDTTRNPLDALTSREITSAVAALRAADHVDDDTLYSLITLREPPKTEVLEWKPGKTLPRRAFVIARRGALTFEAVVDVDRSEVESWKAVPGAQPSIVAREFEAAERIVKSHPGWRAAVAERGIVNVDAVVCIPLAAGYFGTTPKPDRRRVKVVCFDSDGVTSFWGRPIGGLVAEVDLDAGKVIELVDSGPAPIPRGAVDLDEASVGTLRAPPARLSVGQPGGPSFVLSGHEIRWQKWSFHLRIDPRVGPVVSQVRYTEGERSRSVLFQGSLSELFVPYMSPDAAWYFRTFLDVGEYGVGHLAAPLVPGADCPGNAVFLDAAMADDHGVPFVKERIACVFERYSGDAAWRHFESVGSVTEVRRRTDLVVRFVSAVGNYDYTFDWIFRQDGTIEIAVGASGIEQVQAVASATLAEEGGRDAATYGRMVARNTVAINHDHFFCFRLDLDVDGPKNRFVRDRLVTKRMDDSGPRRSVWVIDSRTLATENDARMRIDLERPALWRVINPKVKGPLGYPVSYHLRPGLNAVSLLDPDDYPQRRAGFTDYHLWVTPYRADERYAAGAYPNQSEGGGGLPRWTRADRPIRDADIVLWYVLGFHHVVRAEDWPVLPTNWHRFELRPFDFFSRNPAIDLPE